MLNYVARNFNEFLINLDKIRYVTRPTKPGIPAQTTHVQNWYISWSLFMISLASQSFFMHGQKNVWSLLHTLRVYDV